MSSSYSKPPDSWIGSAEEYYQGLANLQELDFQRCRSDPWHFIKTHLKTMDEVDEADPFKPFPDLPYLAWLVDFLLTERVLLVPKSRRVLVTWLVAGYCLWDCQFREGRAVALMNEDFAKAKKMIAMHSQLYHSQPAWLKSRFPMKESLEKMEFPTRRSSLTAFEQGENVGRMHAFSRIWIDEAQDQRHPGATYKSMMATTRGRTQFVGGQVVYTGTAKQGWWKIACHDQLSMEKPRPVAWSRQLVKDWAPPPPPEGQKPKPWGVTVSRQRESGFLVMQIHYTADPVKRSQEWYDATHQGVPQEDWEQEYEINWNAKAGRPAIPQIITRRFEIVVPRFTPPAWWPRFSTHDYGTTNPYSCHFHAIAPDGTGYTYWEWYDVGPLGFHLNAIKAQPDFHVLRVRILDGSCWDMTQQAAEGSVGSLTNHMLKSIAQLHNDQGVAVIPAPRMLRDAVKIAAIERVWPPVVPGEPPGPIRWRVMDNCPALLRECEGQVWEKLSYAQALKRNDPEKLVDKDNHAFDEFTYGLLHYSTAGVEPVQLAVTDEEARAKQRREIQDDNFRLLEEEARQQGRPYDDGYDDGLD